MAPSQGSDESVVAGKRGSVQQCTAIDAMLKHNGPFLIDLVVDGSVPRTAGIENRTGSRMPANASAANTGSLTYEEIEKFVAEWFRKLDLHVPADQLLPLVADSDLEMRFPERQVNGLEEFRDWYAGDPAGERSVGVIHLFFDEIHTVDRLAVSWRDERALVDIVVNWQARRWRAPGARSEWVGFIAYQQWEMIRSVSTGRPVIRRYVVNELRPIAGSPPL